VEDLFLGRPISYWVEAQSQIDRNGAVDYIGEIAYLRAKVSYYEKRIHDMGVFMLREQENTMLACK